MKKTVILIFIMALLLLCSCGSRVEKESTKVAFEGIEENSTIEKKLVLLIDNQEVPVKWENCKAVNELIEFVSDNELYIQMGMYAKRMQMGSLGKYLFSEDTELTVVKGDILLRSGNCIVLFYGTDTGKYTKLGHIDLSEYEISVLLEKHAVNIILKAE